MLPAALVIGAVIVSWLMFVIGGRSIAAPGRPPIMPAFARQTQRPAPLPYCMEPFM